MLVREPDNIYDPNAVQARQPDIDLIFQAAGADIWSFDLCALRAVHTSHFTVRHTHVHALHAHLAGPDAVRDAGLLRAA